MSVPEQTDAKYLILKLNVMDKSHRHKEEEWLLTLLRIISGARYSGVPHSVQVRPFTRLAKPKSVTWGRKTKTVTLRKW